MKRNLVGTAAFFAAASVLTACDGGGDQPPATSQRDVTGALVGTVTLSQTHTVSFVEYADGDVGIQETMNIDRDLDAPVKLVGMSLEGRTLTDIYRLFAGQQMDATVLGKLQGLDARIGAASGTRAITPQIQTMIDGDGSLKLLSASGTATAPAPAKAVALATPSGLEARQSAVACAEPAWDWIGDDGWFKVNFCGQTSKACFTEVNWANTGWHVGGWFTATGFAQSHCASANWNVQKKTYGGFPFYGIAVETLVNTTLAPRTLQTNAWTNISSSHAYFAQVTSSTNANRTALAFLSN